MGVDLIAERTVAVLVFVGGRGKDCIWPSDFALDLVLVADIWSLLKHACSSSVN